MIEDLNNTVNANSLRLNDIKENNIPKFINNIKNNLTIYKNKKIQVKLLFDARTDGRDSKACHCKCNNKPNTFSVITTTKGVKLVFLKVFQ